MVPSFAQRLANTFHSLRTNLWVTMRTRNCFRYSATLGVEICKECLPITQESNVSMGSVAARVSLKLCTKWHGRLSRGVICLFDWTNRVKFKFPLRLTIFAFLKFWPRTIAICISSRTLRPTLHHAKKQKHAKTLKSERRPLSTHCGSTACFEKTPLVVGLLHNCVQLSRSIRAWRHYS